LKKISEDPDGAKKNDKETDVKNENEVTTTKTVETKP
jgi:hypothetical protein